MGFLQFSGAVLFAAGYRLFTGEKRGLACGIAADGDTDFPEVMPLISEHLFLNPIFQRPYPGRGRGTIGGVRPVFSPELGRATIVLIFNYVGAAKGSIQFFTMIPSNEETCVVLSLLLFPDVCVIIRYGFINMKENGV